MSLLPYSQISEVMYFHFFRSIISFHTEKFLNYFFQYSIFFFPYLLSSTFHIPPLYSSRIGKNCQQIRDKIVAEGAEMVVWMREEHALSAILVAGY